MKEDLKDAKILIVDDQSANIDVLENLLTIKGYYHIKTTTESRDAVSLLQEFNPDLLLLDLMMPHVSGFDIMKQLREMGLFNGLMPIMVLTADVTPETKKRALSEGANDFLTKPFDLTEVDLRIRNMLMNVFLMSQLTHQNIILEEKVNNRTKELQHSLAELERAKKMLEKKISAIQAQNITLREIAWIQSHVVRAPLARLMAAISIFDLENISNIDLKKVNQIILDSANELDGIVRDITHKSNNAHLFEDENI